MQAVQLGIDDMHFIIQNPSPPQPQFTAVLFTALPPLTQQPAVV